MEEVNSKWLQLLLNYTSDTHEIVKETHLNERNQYTIKNYVIQDVTLSYYHGFIAVILKSKQEVVSLLPYLKTHGKELVNGEEEKNAANWTHKGFPCRTFVSGNGRMISFYDLEEEADLSKLFKNRVTTLISLNNALVKFKVDKALMAEN